MLVINEHIICISLPVYERCKTDPCNIYRIIFYNTYTKDVVVIRVRNLFYNAMPDRLLRYKFKIEIPECMEFGTYHYYIVSDQDWVTPENISHHFPGLSQKVTDKGSVECNDCYIMIGNKMLVTSNFKAKMIDINGEVIDLNGNPFIIGGKSSDERVEGEIVKELNIISSGLMKFQESDLLCCPFQFDYPDDQQQTFIQIKDYSNG